jgi:hypothetical protein
MSAVTTISLEAAYRHLAFLDALLARLDTQVAAIAELEADSVVYSNQDTRTRLPDRRRDLRELEATVLREVGHAPDIDTARERVRAARFGLEFVEALVRLRREVAFGVPGAQDELGKHFTGTAHLETVIAEKQTLVRTLLEEVGYGAAAEEEAADLSPVSMRLR